MKCKLKFINLIDLFLFSFIIKITLSMEKIYNLKKLYSISEITMTIVGTGDQYILNNQNITIDNIKFNFNSIPDKILVNGIPLDYVGNMVYGLEKEENTITIIFDNLLTECNVMFYGLRNITKIDLSKFDSSKVTGMAGMFYSCSSIVSINLDNFVTSSVTTMHGMFNGCYKLTSLNLNSFDTSSVTDMHGLFSSCSSITSFELNNFNTSLVEEMTVLFNNCTSLKSLDLGNFDTSSVRKFHGVFKHCSSLLSLNIGSFNTSSCNNFNQMFLGCSSLISLNLSHFDISLPNYIYNLFDDCNKNVITCIDEEKQPLMINLLNSLNENYTNNCSNICFTQSNNKFIKEKSICITECFYDGIYKYEYNNICYENCPNNTHISSDYHHCEDDEIYLNELVPNWNVYEFFNGQDKTNFLNSTIEDIFITKIKRDIISGKLDLTNLISGEEIDFKIKYEDTTYQITTPRNQKNKEYNDTSTIQLGECENILKRIYGIDEELIIFKIENDVPGISIPVIGYIIFHPVNKSILNLTYCKNETINFQIPTSLEEKNLEKYDPNSEYYSDECYSSTTDSGTDILLNDRQEEYNNDNYSLCENNCVFLKLNKTTKKVSCKCYTKSKEYVISEIVKDDNLLSTYNFSAENSFSNVMLMKCVKTIFTKEGLEKNSGNYIIMFIIFAFIILAILFYKFGYELILFDIQEIKSNGGKKYETSEIKIYKNPNKKDKRQSQKFRFSTKKKSKKLSVSTIQTFNKLRKSCSKLELNKKNKNIKSESNKSDKSKEKNINNYNSENFIDYELNSLSYENALKYDKRTFLQYYLSLIRTKHPAIFSFFPIKDYNYRIIKISLFLLLFAIIYILNCLFFNESAIHKIYKDKGIYNFAYFIPRIICSFLISHILYLLIKYYSSSERNIIQIKRYFKNDEKINDIKKSLVIKYICYFTISLGFLSFSWYYLSSFCAVFKNSQVYLIKNTLISLVISLVYPFFINILPGALRFLSLNNDKGNRKKLFQIGKFFQII
jgi:surface protein